MQHSWSSNKTNNVLGLSNNQLVNQYFPSVYYDALVYDMKYQMNIILLILANKNI